MATLAEFQIAHDEYSLYRLGMLITPQGALKEEIGPTGYEKYCNFKRVNGVTKVTIPHIDVFGNRNQYCNIVLTGKTEKYDIPMYGNDFELSVKQYFLEHPTRNGIQYLFWDNEETTSLIEYKAMVPGLIYTSGGNILGYLHSYVSDINGNITLELPYPNYTGYTISGAQFDQQENKIIFRGIASDTQITLSDGESTIFFTLYGYGTYSGINTYKIKNVNEFADYIIAAQLTDGKVTSVLNMLTEMDFRNAVYYPKYFTTLKLYSSSESVKNITPNIYKVPAALVQKGNSGKVFMTNVTGISANVLN